MNKLIKLVTIFLLALVSFNTTYAQEPATPIGSTTGASRIDGKLYVNGMLYPPVYTDTPSVGSLFYPKRPGATITVINTKDTIIYFFTDHWIPLNGKATKTTLGVVRAGVGFKIDSNGVLNTTLGLLPPKMVPFVGSDGELTTNPNFWWDGQNLRAGAGGFYNNSGLILNGGNGQLYASGWGVTIIASGGQPADASKSISFYNGQRPWLSMSLPNTGDVAHDVMLGNASMHWLPTITDSFNIGSSTKRWKNGYFKNIYINGVLFNPDLAGSYVPLTDKAAANGVATLDNTGKVPLNQLPALTTNTPAYVTHISEMLGSSAVVGDLYVVADSSKSYALATLPPSDFNNWIELQAPVPTNTDLLPEGVGNKYYTDARARAAISTTGRITYDNTTGVITVTAPDWDVPGDILNKPTIPLEFNPAEGQHISITGTYPNLTFDTKNIYDSTQTDSITAQLRSEIQVAAGGGVTYHQLDSTATDIRNTITIPSLQQVVDINNNLTSEVISTNQFTATNFNASYNGNTATLGAWLGGVYQNPQVRFSKTTPALTTLVVGFPGYSVSGTRYLNFPFTNGTLIATINGRAPDALGNIVIDTSGTSLGSNNPDSLGGHPASYYAAVTSLSTKVDKTTTINGKSLSANITLLKSDFSDLNNVDNTSDISKPISTATQNALALKANDNAVMHNTGDENIGGKKTYTYGLMGVGPNNFPYVNMSYDNSMGVGGFGFNAWQNPTTHRVELLNVAAFGGKGNFVYVSPLGGLKYQKTSGGIIPSTWINLFVVDTLGNASAPGTMTVFGGNSTNWNTAYSWGNHATAGYLTSALAANTYEPKITKNTAFNKNFGTTAGTIMDAQRIIDSLTAINARLQKKLDTSFRQNVGLVYPLQFDSTNNRFFLSQSYLDSLARNVNPLFTGTAKINSDTLATKADVRATASGGSTGITDFKFLLNRNYANDSLAINVGNLSQGDLYQTNGAVKVINRSVFQYTIDNTDGSANTYSMRMDANTGNVSGTIYWGDGSDTVLTGDIYYELSHTYASGSSYTVKLVTTPSDNLNKLYLNNNGSANIKITSIKNIKSLTQLNTFEAERCNISNIDTLSFPAFIYALSFADNPVPTFNEINLPLASVNLNGTRVQPTGITLPPTVTILSMNAMLHSDGLSTWNATDVNNFLIRLDGMTFNAGAKTLNLVQFNSAAPSGAGLTAKTSLQAKGWTINTD